MKKKMFIMLAVLFSASLFVACSSDDKEDPVEVLKEQLKELAGDYGTASNALNLSYNDENLSDKSASFKLTGDFTGVITLKDVIPGEDTTDLDVDFTPTTRAEATTFNFKDIDEKPERTIEYEGTIKNGAMALTLNVTMGSEQFEGTYTAGGTPALNLLYSGAPMLGASASFKLTGNFDGVITLHNIIPGENDVELGINWASVRNESYSIAFEDEDETAERTIISYKGSIKKGEMTLELDVEMAPAPQNVMGKWALAEAPVLVEWTVDGDGEMTMWAFMLKQVLAQKISPLLETVLQSIDLGTNGDIIAEYSEAGAETIDFKPSAPNLAHYYVKDGKLYALLNVEMITAEASKTRSVATLLGMLVNGIPVDYAVDPNKTLTLTINHELINLVLDALDELGVAEDLFALARVVIKEGMMGIGFDDEDSENLIELMPQLWKNTTLFEIGLNMVAAN